VPLEPVISTWYIPGGTAESTVIVACDEAFPFAVVATLVIGLLATILILDASSKRPENQRRLRNEEVTSTDLEHKGMVGLRKM